MCEAIIIYPPPPSGNTVLQVESCVYSGVQREDDGVQLLQVRGKKNPVLPADEEPGAPSWPVGAQRGVHGHERRVLCLAALRQETKG